MRYDVVIATRNRPNTLRRCLAHLANQSEKPVRVVIVDASDDDATTHGGVFDGLDRKIEWGIVEADCQNAARQRNLGLASTESDVVFLPDDDSMLYQDAAKNMMEGYRSDVDGRIAGVGGCAASGPPQEFLDRAIRSRASLKDRLEPARNLYESRFSPKPFETYAQELWAARGLPDWLCANADFTPVEAIGGYLLSLRRESALEHQFDETLGAGIGYSIHEDMDLCLRLQADGYLLIAAMRAPIFHDRFPGRRAAGYNYGFCWIANYLYVCCKSIPKESPSYRIDLPRFMRHKLRIYRLGALLSRSIYDRDVAAGALDAWAQRSELMDCSSDQLSDTYRRWCTTMIRS